MRIKRVLAMSMAIGMTISLAACGGDNGTSGSDSGSTPENGSAGTQDGTNAGTDGADSDEEPYTVAIQVVNLPGTAAEGIEEREAAINAITEPAINCKVDIQEVWISEVANTTSMAIAGGEKMDLVHVATVQPLSTMVGSDMLYNMNQDDLLNTKGQAIQALFPEELIAAGNVDGKQLAIPAKVFNATAEGIYYNKTFADEHHITIPEKITEEELTDILKQVHEADPSIYPFYYGDGTGEYNVYFKGYENFDKNVAYGAILDSSRELKIENLYATDLFKEYALMIWRWKQDGLQPGDPTDTTVYSEYFGAGKLFCGVADINESNRVNLSATYSDFEVGFAEMVAPKILNSKVVEYMWGIASNSERPDKAMEFLNLIYENADLANILTYGLEGVNYEFQEGTTDIVVPNGTYNPTFFVGGDTEKMYIKAPAGEDYNEKCKEMEKEAAVSPMIGYVFDDSSCQTESALVNAAVLEYLPRISCGMSDSEEDVLALLDEFNAKLEASGIDNIIKENQRQLDEFMANK